MRVYLVGGAVRDELLGRPVHERDWVVVGASAQEMERLGYRAVGRDFPVYLHPQTHEEYALARRERKVGPGYRGFTTQFSPDVTLEQDLQRRDLTINAIARDSDGQLIDPFGGQRDLAARSLRHVSAAFVEDPVRILRVARFAARFQDLGFRVAAETEALMRQMVENGEARSLVPERLWRELARALAEPTPEAFFDTLQACGALAVLLPEIKWHDPARAALRAAVCLSTDAGVRCAALLADIEQAAVGRLAERLRIPTDFRELAQLASRHLERLLQAADMSASDLLGLLEATDAFRRPQRFDKLRLVARALARARLGAAPAECIDHLLGASAATAAAATLTPADRAALQGPQIAAALRAARQRRLHELLAERGRAGPCGT